MINFKQKELIREFFHSINKKFPEVEFVSVTEGPENPADLWINVTEPDDEDREIELGEMASEISTDILLDYGYSILISAGEGMEELITKQDA